jgi:hypothetical protein
MDCAGVCLSGYNGSDSSIEGEWGAFIDSSYIDGDNDGFGKPGTGELYCSSDVLTDGRVNNKIDVNDDIQCESNLIGCENTCFEKGSIPPITKGFLNTDSVCVFVIYPGDVNMDGKADATDIISMVNNWGSLRQGTGYRRESNDLNGDAIGSKTDWQPHFVEYKYLSDESDSCQVRSDANGDGIIKHPSHL